MNSHQHEPHHQALLSTKKERERKRERGDFVSLTCGHELRGRRSGAYSS